MLLPASTLRTISIRQPGHVVARSWSFIAFLLASTAKGCFVRGIKPKLSGSWCPAVTATMPYMKPAGSTDWVDAPGLGGFTESCQIWCKSLIVRFGYFVYVLGSV